MVNIVLNFGYPLFLPGVPVISRFYAPKARMTASALVIGMLVLCGEPAPFAAHAQVRPPASGQDPESSQSMVHLYFADSDHRYLRAEERSVPRSEDPTEFGKRILDALIQGPHSDLMRTLPEGTGLRAFFIAEDRTAYADFSAELSQRHPGGAQTELLTVYSIVNSLLLNLPQIEAVRILIAGHEPTTLAGHVSLQFAYTANMLLIR
jgi:hypothetical protein